MILNVFVCSFFPNLGILQKVYEKTKFNEIMSFQYSPELVLLEDQLMIIYEKLFA